MSIAPEATAEGGRDDLDSQRRVQGRRFVAHLARIAIATVVLGGLLAAIALAGAFNSPDTNSSNTRVAFGVCMVMLSLGLAAGLWAYLAYRHRVRHLLDEPVRSARRHDASSDLERFQRFLREVPPSSPETGPSVGEGPPTAVS